MDSDSPKTMEILDLDEPEEEVRAETAPDCPPPAWSGDEQLLIDVKGNIHVRGGRFFSSRVVGKVRGEDGEATIAMLVERFQALEERFAVLKKEVADDHNLVRHLKSMTSLVHWIEGAKAIGDFPDLLERAHAELAKVEEKLTRSRRIKGELIARAEELSDSEAWRVTGQEMNEMMDRWKRAGSGGGKEDDALWQRFRTARSRFFDRRSRHSAEIRKDRKEAVKAKEALILQARELSESRDWDSTFEGMMALMDEWKTIHSAGRKADDELFQQFRDAREPFFEARKKHFAEERRRTERPRKDARRSGRRSRPEGPAPARRAPTTGLQASLAELVGPLRDLFPEERKGEGKGPKSGKTRKPVK